MPPNDFIQCHNCKNYECMMRERCLKHAYTTCTACQAWVLKERVAGMPLYYHCSACGVYFIPKNIEEAVVASEVPQYEGDPIAHFCFGKNYVHCRGCDVFHPETMTHICIHPNAAVGGSQAATAHECCGADDWGLTSNDACADCPKYAQPTDSDELKAQGKALTMAFDKIASLEKNLEERVRTLEDDNLRGDVNEFAAQQGKRNGELALDINRLTRLIDHLNRRTNHLETIIQDQVRIIEKQNIILDNAADSVESLCNIAQAQQARLDEHETRLENHGLSIYWIKRILDRVPLVKETKWKRSV